MEKQMERFLNKFDYITDTFFKRYLNDEEALYYKNILNENLSIILKNESYHFLISDDENLNSLHKDKKVNMLIDKEYLKNIKKYKNIKNTKVGTIIINIEYLELDIKDTLTLNNMYQKYDLYKKIIN